MGDRRQARELALQALFFLDMDKSDPDENLAAFCLNNEDLLTENVKPFFLDLIKGVLEHRTEIDALLHKYSKNWRITRMPVVDRNIMRMATFEYL
jgi:N utilization substance protein B